MSEFVNIQIARSDRKDEVTKEREERRLRVEQRETERIAREEEERRIYNLPENIEARRLAAEQAELRRLEQQLINQLARTRREEQKKKQLKEARIRANEVLSIESKEFNNACSNYGIPVFDASFGQTTWEINFLVDIKERMLKKKELSRHQIQTLAPIIRNNMATEKQLSYLKDLGYKGVVKTKKEASKEIEKLTEMKE